MAVRRYAPFALLALAACHQGQPTPTPSSSPSPAPTVAEATPVPAPPPASEAPATPSQSASAIPAPDAGALREHKDPDRLLGYLAEAIDAGRWDDAAKAWQDGTDGAGVKKLFGSPEKALVTFGKGDEEGAAGSLYYEAPMLLLANNGESQRQGTITLRRVNDVPGASEASLAWHVERIEWKK